MIKMMMRFLNVVLLHQIIWVLNNLLIIETKKKVTTSLKN